MSRSKRKPEIRWCSSSCPSFDKTSSSSTSSSSPTSAPAAPSSSAPTCRHQPSSPPPSLPCSPSLPLPLDLPPYHIERSSLHFAYQDSIIWGDILNVKYFGRLCPIASKGVYYTSLIKTQLYEEIYLECEIYWPPLPYRIVRSSLPFAYINSPFWPNQHECRNIPDIWQLKNACEGIAAWWHNIGVLLSKSSMNFILLLWLTF